MNDNPSRPSADDRSEGSAGPKPADGGKPAPRGAAPGTPPRSAGPKPTPASLESTRPSAPAGGRGPVDPVAETLDHHDLDHHKSANPSESAEPASPPSAGAEPTVGLERTASFSGESSGSQPLPQERQAAGRGAAAPTPGEGHVIANRFIVHRLLGQGGMGRVFSVQDNQIEGRDVALKVLLPKYSKNAHFRKLFFQEVRAAQEFVSEYICQVRDTGETEDGSLFLTMDLVEGEALRALLDREKLLGQRQALEITRQVLLGLQSGHDKGYVHRDIKPSNVMLAARVPKTDTNPYGVGVRILDFGIAGLATQIDERSRAGTVMYMSPEQASGERLDPRSDLFAVGVLLFEMLSGHRPFEGSTTRALVQSVLETNLTARLGEIPGLSKQVRKLLERALQKDRNRRFQSAGEFAEAIAKSAAYRLPQNVPAWIYGGLAAAACVAGAEGFLLFSRSGEADSLRERLAKADGERLQAVDTARGEKDAVIRERDSQLEQRQTELSALKSELDRVRAEVAQAEGSAGDKSTQLISALEDVRNKQTQIDDLKGQLASERDEKSNLSLRVSKLEQDFKEAEQETQRLQAERDEARLQGSPKGQLAGAFDRVATLLEGGYGAFARTALEQYESAAVFAKDDGQLHQFLSAVVAASAALEAHQKSVQGGGPPQLAAIRAAETRLGSARELLSALDTNPGEWKTVAPSGAEPPKRMAQARLLVDKLAAELQAELAASAGLDLAAWKQLDLARASADPGPFFEHFNRFGCREHMTAAARRVVDTLQAEAQVSGRLQLEALDRTRSLGQWVELVDGKQVELDAAAAGLLRLFEFAQRWHDTDAANDGFDWDKASLPPVSGKSTDWRQVLKLQHALAQPGSAYPIPHKGLALVRQVDEFGAVSWIEFEDRSKSDDGRNWNIRRRIADADGNFSAETFNLALERGDGSIRAQDGNAVFLEFKSRAGDTRVEPLPPCFAGAVPHALLSPQQLEGFRRLYGASAESLCLVVQDDRGATRWFSPKFGLVREEITAGWTREIVYFRGSP